MKQSTKLSKIMQNVDQLSDSSSDRNDDGQTEENRPDEHQVKKEEIMANLKKLNLLSPQTQTIQSEGNQILSPLHASSPQNINSEPSDSQVKPPSISSDSDESEEQDDPEDDNKSTDKKRNPSDSAKSKQNRLNAMAAIITPKAQSNPLSGTNSQKQGQPVKRESLAV